jgi:predicted protein tyrosine phosphatase
VRSGTLHANIHPYAGRGESALNTWTWGLEWGEVRTDLLVGSCPIVPGDIEHIRESTGVTALLSLQTDRCRADLGIDYAAHLRRAEHLGLVLENAPMRDFDLADQRRQLPAAMRALRGLLVAGHRVFVHCTAGVNRSPLTVLGYLTFVEDFSPEVAFDLIRRSRPQAAPYWEAYHGCRADLAERLRELVQLRAFLLSERGTGRGPLEDWLEAERQVIREALARPDSDAWQLLDAPE